MCMLKFDTVILAGGQSLRMGQDKGLIEYHGKTMLEGVLNGLAGTSTIWINANQHEEEYQALGYDVIADIEHEDIGPLAGPLLGILTGLQCATSDWVLFSPCDTPNLPKDYSQRMTTFASDNLCYACVANDGQRQQNLHVLLHKNLAEGLMMYLLSGGRKTYQWLDRIAAKSVDFSDEAGGFKNMNEPSDLD